MSLRWKDYYNGAERRPRCRCGKIAFSKKDAQTKRNWLEKKGKERQLRIYQCPDSNTWHLTKLI